MSKGNNTKTKYKFNTPKKSIKNNSKIKKTKF